MFIRRTVTRRTEGRIYYTHRLVRSERDGEKVRQRTVLRYFTRRRASRVTDTVRDVAGSHTQTPSGDSCGLSVRAHYAHLLSRYSCVQF